MGRGFGALRHRNFRLYWSGQVISLIGTWMQSVSQPWLVLELGGSPLQVGSVIALQFAPALFLSPLGGVLADRFDKRSLLLITQALAMVQAATLFGLTVHRQHRDLAHPAARPVAGRDERLRHAGPPVIRGRGRPA